MTPSIRRFLLINLLVSITVVTSLTAIGNYYLDQKDIQSHLDVFLVQATHSMQALLNAGVTPHQLKKMQQDLNQLVNHKTYTHSHIKPTAEKFQFQVWDNDGHLLLHSPNAPKVPFTSGTVGFSQEDIDGTPWRVFSSYHQKSGLSVLIAERSDTREELVRLMAKDDIYIVLCTYPLLGLLIWIIIGRGLSSIKRVTEEVSHRAPNYLEPVDLKTVPVEIKSLVDELNHLLLRLQQGLEREKRFSADAAHELRTPLAALKTQAQVAFQAMDHKELQNAVKKVIRGVDRSAHVVEQLLTLSRLMPDANIIEDQSQLNLRYIVTEELALLAPLAIKKDIELALVAKDRNYPILANSTAISILVKNVVDNAIRYSPSNSEVQVQLTQDRKAVTMKVIDSGPGIPAALRARVFERFYRILGTKAHGSGLGLAIVQQIANLHHAQVKLGSSTELGGLEITITFPKNTEF